MGMGITFSSDSGTLQLFFVCYYFGLTWILGRSLIRDISCRTTQVGSESSFCIFTFKICHRSRVGLTLSSLKANWYPTQSETCLGSSSVFYMFTTQPSS